MASKASTRERSKQLHRKYAETVYKLHMSQLTSRPTPAPEEDLQDLHNRSVLSSLQILSEVEPLTEDLRTKISKYLQRLFHTIKRVNEEKSLSAQAIGLDIGFSSSRVAVCRNDRIFLGENSNGRTETPSYVVFEENSTSSSSGSSRNNPVVDVFVGESAKRFGISSPESSIFGMKEMIGNTRPNFFNGLPFETSYRREKVFVKVGVQQFSLEQLLTKLVESLKRSARDHLLDTGTGAVITVPPRFNFRQREFLKEVCTVAGLNVLQILNEPTAAALAYNLSSEDRDHFLIFDLGGRKLDVTVFEARSQRMVIKALGQELIGGQDFDQAMVRYCLQQFQKMNNVKLNTEQSEKDKRNFRQLDFECEREKKYLSSAESVTVSIPAFHKDLDLVIPISRELFEELNQEQFDLLLEKVDETIEKAGIRKSEISAVVLAGGSSFIPKIQEELRKYFKKGNAEILCSIPPSEVVVKGAALVAGGGVPNPELVNVEVQEMESEDARSVRSRSYPDFILFDPSTPTIFKGTYNTSPADFSPTSDQK